jgi:serine/threonine protein kinase
MTSRPEDGKSDDDATKVPWRRTSVTPESAPVADGSKAEPSPPPRQPPRPVKIRQSTPFPVTGARQAAPWPSQSGPGHQLSRPLGAGDVLDGRYTLVEELGRGGMGTVFKALDANRVAFQDRQPYIALKVLREAFKRHPDALMALQRETVRAQSLGHENIVRVHDFDFDGTHAYMTMELLEGQPMDDWLLDKANANATFEQRWSIVCGIGAGLSCAHKNGVVHSDLKPGNVFLCKNGGIKVMDFGIARPLRPATAESDATLFDAASRLGAVTPAYASLEQLNQGTPDPRDDIYAFACVVYWLFSGKHPFGRKSAKAASEEHLVPQRIASLTRLQWETLRRGLALQRSERIATIDEFLRQFAPRTWWSKHRALVGAVTLAVIAPALFFGTRYYNDYVEDQALNAQLWPSTNSPAVQPTKEQQSDIDDFLYLAKEGLDQAASAGSPEEMSAILSGAANNVLELLKGVYRLQPDNPKVLQMAEQASHLYAIRALGLLANQQPGKALTLLLEGQNIRHTPELFRLKRRLCGDYPAVCASSLRTARAHPE